MLRVEGRSACDTIGSSWVVIVAAVLALGAVLLALLLERWS